HTKCLTEQPGFTVPTEGWKVLGLTCPNWREFQRHGVATENLQQGAPDDHRGLSRTRVCVCVCVCEAVSQIGRGQGVCKVVLTSFCLHILNSQYNKSELLLHSHACVFWDYSQNDWNTSGCTKETETPEVLRCSCNHTTNFAILMSFKINYKYAKPLEIVSYVGCGLSIAGLTMTILFQILTRKTRKPSVTCLLVSLCTSMLIFNIIFVFGIDNPNGKNNRNVISTTNTMLQSDKVDPPSNEWCTAVAALLHYFLLATFMWTALNSIQLYLLLLQTMRLVSGHFTLIMSITGWGFPALVVAITLGTTSSSSNYRQEEFCWLAALDEQGNFSIKKPMLWALLLPVALILLFNIIMFVKIMVSVMWKKNKNLTSNKKESLKKKILGSLSIAVVLGVTWILGYLMLIDHEQSNIAFSYIFCICNATQGLQIFILYTLRTPVFKKKFSEILVAITSTEIPVYLHSKTYNPGKLHNKKHIYEAFRSSESMSVSEEIFFSDSNQTE
uniref:Adhesion G protein-coupled receptor G7 n=1 Tax=Sphenodon punctatus TaxID=8508 RepID=A0A8D0GC68_SPHPU